MARPKKENHPISIRMDKAIYDRLNEFCEVSGQPKTVAIERALAAYMQKYNSELVKTEIGTKVVAANDRNDEIIDKIT